MTETRNNGRKKPALWKTGKVLLVLALFFAVPSSVSAEETRKEQPDEIMEEPLEKEQDSLPEETEAEEIRAEIRCKGYPGGWL
jgi:hypothetical protein